MFSKITEASNLAIYHKVALGSISMSTGYDIIRYFRSSTNYVNV